MLDGVDKLDGDDELLLLLLLLLRLLLLGVLLLLLRSLVVEFTLCVTVSDVFFIQMSDFFMSLSKSLIKSPMPPTSHSLSSYSKLFSFDSAFDSFDSLVDW